MKDTTLYEQLLGLKTPWSVKSVELSLAEQRVVVEVVMKKGQVWADPTDATKRAHVNGWSERQWRYLDTCQFETIVKARVPQLKYSDGMWPAYMSAARQCMPQADIVHDKFHVAKYLGDAVDAVRKQEHRSLSKAGTSPLTGSKWAWLRRYPDGRSAEAISFRALYRLNLKTSRAWCIKENFTQFWRYSYKGAAKRFFDAWSTSAMRSRLEPVKKVVKMLRRHEGGLLNFSQHKISNACAEGFNSVIQLIKANARGFRSFTNYRARILVHCGKLEMGLG